MAPNLIEQSVRGEQGPGLPYERAQDGEWRRRERDSGSVAQQVRVRLVELESVEAHTYRIRTGRRSGVVGAFSHFDTNGVPRPSCDWWGRRIRLASDTRDGSGQRRPAHRRLVRMVSRSGG